MTILDSNYQTPKNARVVLYINLTLVYIRVLNIYFLWSLDPLVNYWFLNGVISVNTFIVSQILRPFLPSLIRNLRRELQFAKHVGNRFIKNNMATTN